MTTLAVELEVPGATRITGTDDALTAELADGRLSFIPLAWYPMRIHAMPAERNNWKLCAASQYIHWADLDEDINVEGLLAGRQSQESQASFERWLDARRAGRVFTLDQLRHGE